MRALHYRDDAPVGAAQMMKCYLETLLISLMRDGKNYRPVVKPETDAELTVRVKGILSEKLYGSVTLDEISKRLFFSKTCIGTRFKADVGCSVISYFNKSQPGSIRCRRWRPCWDTVRHSILQEYSKKLHITLPANGQKAPRWTIFFTKACKRLTKAQKRTIIIR